MNGTLSTVLAEAHWAVARGIAFDTSMVCGALSFVLEGRFLLIHVSPPSPVGSWANAFVMLSLRFLQAQAAANGFWQLKQPVTSHACSVPDMRKLVVNVCCVAHDMCVDGSPCVNPTTFFSNHACNLNWLHDVVAAMITLRYSDLGMWSCLVDTYVQIWAKVCFFRCVEVVICDVCFSNLRRRAVSQLIRDFMGFESHLEVVTKHITHPAALPLPLSYQPSMLSITSLVTVTL